MLMELQKNMVLKRGESYSAEFQESIQLTAGDAKNITIIYNGKQYYNPKDDQNPRKFVFQPSARCRQR